MSLKLIYRLAPIAFVIVLTAFVGGIGWAVISLPAAESAVSARVVTRLEQSGVENPVTAVLLSFRAYDTLLEVAVLLIAALGARMIGPARAAPKTSVREEEAGVVLSSMVRLLAPLIVLIAGYLLWSGAIAPGGAFQAGAVLASLGVLVVLTDSVSWRRLPAWMERVALTAGLLVFTCVGLAVMVTGGQLLQYPPQQATWWILLIEVACTLSIAVGLTGLFVGGRLSEARELRRRPQTDEEEKSP